MYYIGIKKRLYGSDSEVEWRYAAVDSGKPKWTRIGAAVGFVGIADAERWWEENAETLLSDPNVLKETAEIRKMTVETEAPLPYDFKRKKLEAQARIELAAVCGKLRAIKSDLGEDLFLEIFGGPVSAIIGKSEEKRPSFEKVAKEKTPQEGSAKGGFLRETAVSDETGEEATPEEALARMFLEGIFGLSGSDF